MLASEKLDYGLACKVQSSKMKPPSPDASFPTLKLKVGYAYKHETGSEGKMCTTYIYCLRSVVTSRKMKKP
jgi:hypothetical protein